MDKNQLWQGALGELELSLSKANFMTWFKNTFVVSCEEGRVIIGVPNTFTKAWFEKKYHSEIMKSLQKIAENKIREVVYQVVMSRQTPDTMIQATHENSLKLDEKNQVRNVLTIGLNPRYTFNNFIIGKANELAQAACTAVSENPGNVYNPLFIYGGVGLGKTHLLQAIGNKLLSSGVDKKVLYVSCEKFTSDFIKSISSNITERFKNIYRSVDVLLIDDIQFLAGKEGTQEEFFHTFNALHQNNKQIVVSSDRPPKAIPALESRLVSRFEWGMIADISTPDFETRTAILETKCREKNIALNPEVLHYIAENIQNNVRELEGALNRIIAYTQLHGTSSMLDIAKKIMLSAQPQTQRKSLTPKTILAVVSQYYDIKIEDILGSCRKKNFAVPRQIIMYLMREEIKSSYPTIGQEIGNRDHTTAIHAHLKISRILGFDQKLQRDIESLRELLYK